MDHFSWMIEWVWESLIGNDIPYVFHHSFLEDSIGKQEGFHLNLPLSHDVSHVGFHTWEAPLEGRFITDYFEQWWGILLHNNLSPSLKFPVSHIGGLIS